MFLHKLVSVLLRPTSLFSLSPRPTCFAMAATLLQSPTFPYSPFPIKVNLSTPHDEWPQNIQCWRKKPNSINGPYNRHNNSNYVVGGQNFYSSVTEPDYITPYDICFRGRRNRGSVGATLHGENKESRIHEIKRKPTNGSVLRPGMVLLKKFLSHDEQVEIVKVCRELGVGLGGFYLPLNPNGTPMQLRMMCLGRNWNPVTHKYGKMRPFDRTIPPSIPNNFSELVTRAIQEAQSLTKKKYRACNEKEVLPSMTPDICIVNFYRNSGKLGLHQDRDESKESLRKGLPVVSFSVGDSAYFLYGDERNAKKANSVALNSGDVLIFGGKSRHVFHGVPAIFPNSAPKELMKDSCLSPGRLNLTFRQF